MSRHKRLCVAGMITSVFAGSVAVVQAGQVAVPSSSVSTIAATSAVEYDRIRLTYEDSRSGVKGSVLLSPVNNSVKKVVSAADGYFIAIGDIGAGELISLVDEYSQTVVDRMLTSAAAVSPDERVIVFQGFTPRMAPPSSAEYYAMSVGSLSASTKLWARRIFPSDQKRHSRASDIQWVRADVVAFLDYTPGETALVVAEVDPGAEVRRMKVRPLPTNRLVNAEDVDGGSPPAVALSGAKITDAGSDDAGLVVRLTFRTSTALKVNRVDVEVWD